MVSICNSQSFTLLLITEQITHNEDTGLFRKTAPKKLSLRTWLLLPGEAIPLVGEEIASPQPDQLRRYE
jgi:hypothetical protein